MRIPTSPTGESDKQSSDSYGVHTPDTPYEGGWGGENAHEVYSVHNRADPSAREGDQRHRHRHFEDVFSDRWSRQTRIDDALRDWIRQNDTA